VDEFIMRIDEAFGETATQTVVNNNTDMRMLHSSARRNHLSFVFTTGAEDPIMKVFSKVLLGRPWALMPALRIVWTASS